MSYQFKESIELGDAVLLHTKHRKWFWTAFSISCVIAYIIGASMNGQGGVVLGLYLIFCPGFFGFGWFIIYSVWTAAYMKFAVPTTLKALEDSIRLNVAKFGPVQFLDFKSGEHTIAAMAVVGSKLFIGHGTQLSILSRAEISKYRWDIKGATIIHGGNASDRFFFNQKSRAEANEGSGFYIGTFDPAYPELFYQTSSEEVCRRWEMIMDNIFAGRLHID